MSSAQQVASPDEQAELERQRITSVLETMVAQISGEEGADNDNQNDDGDDETLDDYGVDPRVDWLINATSGDEVDMAEVWVDDAEDEEDGDYYDDGDYLGEEDDEGDDDDDDDEDDEVDLVEGDEDQDRQAENEDDDDEEVIDLSTLFRAAAQGTTDGDGVQSRTARALTGIGLEGLRRLLNTGRLQFRQVGGADDDDDDDDSTLYYGGAGRRGTTTRMSEFWEPVKEPIPAGSELLYGGEFGRPPISPVSAPKSRFAPSKNMTDTIQGRRRALRRVEKHELAEYVPNTNGTEVARYPARSYCGQYSEDSSFFYSCTQTFQVHLYDTTAAPSRQVHRFEDAPRYTRSYYASSSTSHLTSLKPIKTIQGRQGSWTITDANLSPDNQWMIYSSITPYVYLVPTQREIESGGTSHSDDQVMLDFSNRGNDDAGIWSIRFSGDSHEIVAGAHFGDIYVYDIEARRRVLKVEGHSDDVNGVTFADTASSHILISGSDDSFVKVWDRRSLSSGKPAGVFIGHTEGITFVAPKGDGRYCISNGKDQGAKLWDLRNMKSNADFDRCVKIDYGVRNFDYRSSFYKKPRYLEHPDDCSVMTYRGHAVLRTLIRCHFSPVATTGQKYIYSGSADGRIHIWSLDGRVVQVLDRAKATPLCMPGSSEASDPSAAVPSSYELERQRAASTAAQQAEEGNASRYSRSYMWNSRSSESCTVRDVSWHSSEPAIMSTAWDGPDGQHGSIAKHEWKGYGKNGLSLEDAIEKSIQEAAR